MSTDFELPAKQQRLKSGRPPEVPAALSTPAPPVDSPLTGNASSGEKTNPNGEPSYPQEELLRVFDEIIFSGEYQETYTIRDRVPVVFKNRSAEEMSEIQMAIDAAGYNLISTVESVRSLKNLEYALVSYHGKDLSMLKMEDRAKFIGRLPGPVVGMLFMLLSKFDNKVSQACREGEANF